MDIENNLPSLIDSHAHIFAEQFNEDREAMIERALAIGVSCMLLPNIDSTSMLAMLSCAEKYPGICKPMMGLHPCSVNMDYESELNIVKEELKKGIYVGVGEVGLDYYWDITFKNEQIASFRAQIGLAQEYELPIVIHTRNSFEDAFAIIKEMKSGKLRGVFHCFSGTMQEAEMIMGLGDFYMGIGGVLTFKNSGVDKVVKDIPIEYLLLETDSPYLAPVPNRGKRNEPAFLMAIAEKLAEIKNITPEEVALATSKNSRKLFNL
jgi:TatD DNase family protein